MKIIFLDIDGVLNSDEYQITSEYQEAAAEFSNILEMLNKAPEMLIDSSLVKRFNILVKKSQAKVVLSSTWRTRFSNDEMNEILKARGANFEISDRTQVKMSSYWRGSEIAWYLEGLSKQPEAFVILDDIDQFPDYQDNFVHTVEAIGLTEKDVDKALKILKVL